MISQRKAREVALQVLFQQGFQENVSPIDLFNGFADNFKFDVGTRDYALFLVQSVMTNEDKLNTEINKYSQNWRLDRMAVIDKILLQIAIFELCFSDQTTTAPKLCIIDILDLTKKYSSQESSQFINGILDQILNRDSIKS